MDFRIWLWCCCGCRARNEERGAAGRIGDQANEFLGVSGRRNAAQLGDGPLPAIARRLERNANESAGRKLRPGGKARKRGNSEPTGNHLENHFGQQNFLNFARLNACGPEDFCQKRAFRFRGIDQEIFSGEIFEGYKIFRSEGVTRGTTTRASSSKSGV